MEPLKAPIQVIKASAGSGKTYTITLCCILRLLLKYGQKGSTYNRPLNVHRSILAVTFTNDATNEMKQRIIDELALIADDRSQLYNSLRQYKVDDNTTCDLLDGWSRTEVCSAAKGILSDILHDYTHFNIVTIDSFMQRLLRNLAHELGIGSQLSLDLDTQTAVANAVDTYAEQARTNDNVRKTLTTFLRSRLDDQKSWNILEELKKFGKHIYDEDFQSQSQQLHEQLKQFDSKELNNELNKVVNDILTPFHQIGNELNELITSNPQWNNSNYSKNYLSDVKSTAKRLIDYTKGDIFSNRMRTSIDNPDKAFTKQQTSTADLLQFVYKVNTLLRSAQELVDDEITQKRLSTAELIRPRLYQLFMLNELRKISLDESKEQNKYMLSDTAILLSELIKESDAPFIFERIDAIVDTIFIDEAQDTSKLQWELFFSLIKSITSNDGRAIIVGDVKQSIYRWRNSDWSILNNINQQPGLNATINTLDTNWRSYKNVVEGNNDIFDKTAKTINIPDITTAYCDVKQKAVKNDGGLIRILTQDPKETPKDTGDLMMLGQLITQIVDLRTHGVQAKDICILCRKNKQTTAIQHYLTGSISQWPDEIQPLHDDLQKEGYLDLVTEKAMALSSSTLLQYIIACLRYIDTPNDLQKQAIAAILYRQLIGCENTFALTVNLEERIQQLPKSLQNAQELSSKTLLECINSIISDLQNLEERNNGTNGRQIIDNNSSYLNEFINAAIQFSANSTGKIREFVEQWDNSLADKTITFDSGDAMKAMTIHKSKGLEFHTVIIPYCNDLMFEHSKSIFKEITTWVKGGNIDNKLPELPQVLLVEFSTALEQSFFSNAYEKEKNMQYMDNLNTMYVAFTRAKCNLIAIANTAKGNERFIKNYLYNQQPQILDKDWTLIDSQNLWYQLENGTIVATITKDNPSNNNNEQTNNERDEQIVSCYHHFNEPQKTTFVQSQNAKYYFADNDNDNKSTESMIAHGTLIHNIFQELNTLKDLNHILDKYECNGLITAQQKPNLKQEIEQAVHNTPDAAQWFNGEGYKLINEHTIIHITDEGPTELRPDRVMVYADKTVIIDYKTGEKKTQHHQQIAGYMKQLSNMGYQHIEGYLFYTKLQQIVPVSSK